MSQEKLKKVAEEILDLADIKINGDRPWDIQIKNEDFIKGLVSRLFRFR